MTAPTVAQDKLGVMKLVTEGVNLLGQLSVGDSAQNVIAGMLANWGGSGDSVVASASTKWIVGRVAPTSSDYTNAPKGSLFFLLLSNSDQSSNPYDASIYIKTANGWSQITASVTAASHVTIAAGSQVTVGGSATELITVSGITVTDLPFVQIISVGTVGGSVLGASCATTAGVITVTMSADQKVSCKLAYKVIRAVTA